ncbi:MAG: class I SAM-dependent methyltransferase [Anaerolineales bacterium]
MTMSVNFDRAASIYEATRGFPPGIGEVVAEAAVEMMGGPVRALEIGVGTGRIARPLAARGVRLVGVDLSRKMMAELVQRAAGPVPVLLNADATRLPLANQHFDAALSVHVFHLIPNWQEALNELRRVLRPGGVYLTGSDWRPPDAIAGRFFEKWREIVKARGLPGDYPGARDFEDVKKFLLDTGATMEERFVGEWRVARTVAHALETIEHRTWSSTWDVPEQFFSECLAELRAWAEREFGPPETTFTATHKFCWQAFRWE